MPQHSIHHGSHSKFCGDIYAVEPYLCPPNSGCTDPQEKAMKEACQGAYVNKIGNIIGCERCELPLCTIIKESFTYMIFIFN